MESLPISALQHLLYCERQCALIHLEQEWTENRFTAEGRVLHERAHEGPDESRLGIRITRGLPVASTTHRLHGVCDVVEFHRDGRVIPVEYKRGKPKDHRADEVQLCAQALCLEETLTCSIPEGFLFYGKPRRRTIVPFDEALRALVQDAAVRLHQMLQAATLPPPEFEKKKCGACSLLEICLPRRPFASAQKWFSHNLNSGAASPLPR